LASKNRDTRSSIVESVFRYLEVEPFRRDARMRQTDGRTDRQTRSWHMPRFTTMSGHRRVS